MLLHDHCRLADGFPYSRIGFSAPHSTMPPVRAAGHVTAERFITQRGQGKNSFATDPLNVSASGWVGVDGMLPTQS